MTEAGVYGWLALLHVAIGGGAGGALRFLVSGWVASRIAGDFPWGTLAVNASGAFLIGIIAALPPPLTAAYWPLLVIGLLGSYTTVSAFSLQTLDLLREGAHARAAGNVAGSLLACLAAAGAGLALGSMW